MRFLFITISFLFHANYLQAFELQTGDVILQPLKCWSCRLIEDQEKSDFSHIGIIIKEDTQIYVAEAYGKVRKVTLAKFLEKTHPDKKNKYLRLKVSEQLNRQNLSENIENFLGNPYDAEFRWNNYEQGQEKIYCSELVYKVLAPLVSFYDLQPKVMLFDENPDYWDRFFRGDTPRGEYGISPEDFNQSSDFLELEQARK